MLHNMAHNHTHMHFDWTSTASRDGRIFRVTILGGIANFLLLLAKFVAGFLGHSSAMIADAVHSLSDFLTDIVVLLFVKIDSRHPNGNGRYETIATAIISIALIGVAVSIAWEGAQKILTVYHGGTLETPGVIALVAAIASILVKEWIFRITRHVAREVNSEALEANAWHHRSDALSSVGSMLGIGGALLLGGNWAILDPIAGIIVSVVILVVGIRLLLQSAGELIRGKKCGAANLPTE